MNTPATGMNPDGATGGSAMLAEIAALRQRLVALEESRPNKPAGKPPRRRAKPPRLWKPTGVRVATGALLTVFAGATVVYGQDGMDALFIDAKGNAALGPSRLDSNFNYRLHVSGNNAKTSTIQTSGLLVSTSDPDHPFGLGISVIGASAIGGRTASLNTFDVNQEDGGHITLQSGRGNVGIGTREPDAANKLQVTGRVQADIFVGKGAVPDGAIVMWSGDPTRLPAGWALCDGENGTPNLSGRFIVGYASGNPDYAMGARGGADKVTLTIEQMPAHKHTGETEPDTMGKHIVWSAGSTNGYANAEDHGVQTHKHKFTTNATGGGQPFDNRPAYFALAYIMYIGSGISAIPPVH